jgi:chloride channel protein, CIC family
MTDAGQPEPERHDQPARAAALARLALPAAVVGVGCALALITLTVLADRVEDLLWDVVPGWFGLDGTEWGWILLMLTAVGIATGVLVTVLPGHAGPDPATQSLVSPPLPAAMLPSLAIVVILSLGGGVSLGPENPIIAINVALAVWLGHRALSNVPPPQWIGFAAAGTVGALFATPVGAALLLSERASSPQGPGTWDRMFAPLVAAATGSLTMYVLSRPVFAVDLPAYPGPRWPDLLSGPIIAVAAALVGVVLLVLFPVLHAAFGKLPTTTMLALGGLVLGVLGAVGGTITLFKGFPQIQELVEGDESAWRLAGIAAIKCAALLVASTCGFRGGKIFPATFIGVALGLLAHQLVDGVPTSLAVAAAVLGIVLAVSHSGWISLFLAATIVGQVTVLPVLCIAVLPAWLVITDRPEMELPAQPEPATAR